MVRVLLADDEPLLRAGARAILSTQPSIDVVAEAANGREAVELTRRHRPDVALLDVRMPKLDGLDALTEIRRTVPTTAVIIFTTFRDDGYIDRSLRDGAMGFVLKSGDPNELILAVHAVAEGAAYLSPPAAHRVILSMSSWKAPVTHHVDRLSSREREVLVLLAAGLSNAEIGRRLQLVEGTVKTHVSSIIHRLGVDNRVQAAILAHEAGLIGQQGTAPRWAPAGPAPTTPARPGDRPRGR